MVYNKLLVLKLGFEGFIILFILIAVTISVTNCLCILPNETLTLGEIINPPFGRA